MSLQVEGWEVEGNLLKRNWKFKNFAESIAFVNQVGELAEAANHHPDIEFGWGYARIALTTHDAGGLTEKDQKLAEQINGIA